MGSFSRQLSGLFGAAAPHPPLGFHSLALGRLHDRLGAEGKHRILDLGPASGENVDFFAHYPCTLYVADFYQNLLSFPAERRIDGEGFREIVGELLSYPEDTRFDAILVWDLFDYLCLDQIEVLSRRLARYSELGTILVALLSLHSEIPSRPRAYQILNGETLRYDMNCTSHRPAPRHVEPHLCRRMPGFRVESTFVLRHGVQEYVFAFDRPALRVEEPLARHASP